MVRGDVAMTGEVTLSGQVLRVGGIEEKLLAAHRGGLAGVILPRGNQKEVDEDLGDELRRAVEVHYVTRVDTGGSRLTELGVIRPIAIVSLHSSAASAVSERRLRAATTSGRCVSPRQSQTDALPVLRGVSLFVRPRSTIDPMSDLGLDPDNWK